MTTAKRFEDLEVWQIAKELTNLIYRLSGEGNFARDFGLRDQMRRASVSVMSNIAEGFESLIHYLETQPNARRVQEEGAHYDIQH